MPAELWYRTNGLFVGFSFFQCIQWRS